MKNIKSNIWFYAACVLFFLVGYNINDAAVSFPKYKVATVDIQQILSKSTELQSLKITQDKEMKELEILISKAQNEILNQSDRVAAKQLEEKYRKEIEDKKLKMDDEYNKKITKITNDIKTLINSEAQKTHYNLVLPTGMVLSGGDNITDCIISKMKN